MQRFRWQRLWPVALLLAALAGAYATGLHRELSLQSLHAHRETLTGFVAAHPVVAPAAFALAYALAVAVSLPGAFILTVVGGFLFGTLKGGIVVILAGTTGSALVFLAARYALGDLLRGKVGPWLARFRDGFRANAFSYLLTLRLIPVFPFFIVNLVPAFLNVPLATFVAATAIGITPAVFIYASVGAGLGAILDRGEAIELAAILTPEIVFGLTGLGLLSLLPVAVKRWRARRSAGRPLRDKGRPG